MLNGLHMTELKVLWLRGKLHVSLMVVMIMMVMMIITVMMTMMVISTILTMIFTINNDFFTFYNLDCDNNDNNQADVDAFRFYIDFQYQSKLCSSSGL